MFLRSVFFLSLVFLGTPWTSLRAENIPIPPSKPEVYRDEEIFKSYRKIIRQYRHNKKQALSQQEIEELFRQSVVHPVATLQNMSKYDPSGAIGFCFGRAMAAHMIALEMGLQEKHILKLFVTGDMRSNPAKPEWRFHVTTLVRRDDGKYMAIDPISYGSTSGYQPFDTSQWIHFVRDNWDVWHGGVPRTKFYLTNAHAIVPDIENIQSPEAGDRLIQLNFDAAKNSWVKGEAWSRALEIPSDITLWQAPRSSVERKFFITAYESSRFNFAGLVIKEETVKPEGKQDAFYNFPYNEYFRDLLKSFEGNIKP